MEVPGLCQACGRPGRLSTCSLCGALVHGECLRTGLHAHGREPAGERRHPDWGEPLR